MGWIFVLAIFGTALQAIADLRQARSTRTSGGHPWPFVVRVVGWGALTLSLGLNVLSELRQETPGVSWWWLALVAFWVVASAVGLAWVFHGDAPSQVSQGETNGKASLDDPGQNA